MNMNELRSAAKWTQRREQKGAKNMIPHGEWQIAMMGEDGHPGYLAALTQKFGLNKTLITERHLTQLTGKVTSLRMKQPVTNVGSLLLVRKGGEPDIVCRFFDITTAYEIVKLEESQKEGVFEGSMVGSEFYIREAHTSEYNDLAEILKKRPVEEQAYFRKHFSSLSEHQFYFLKRKYYSFQKGIPDPCKATLFGSMEELTLRYIVLKDTYPNEIQERIQSLLKQHKTESGTTQAVIKRILQYLICIDWSQPFPPISPEKLMRGLNESHMGMDDVKQRLVEMIHARKIRGQNGKLRPLLLDGPYAVGKTSIAECVAKAAGRPLIRISLNGAGDEIILKGTPDNYDNGNAGRIIRAGRETGAMNYVLLLDELDKVLNGNGERAGLRDALLDLLDGSGRFEDAFLGMCVPIQNLFIIATSNDKNRIPGYLLDRMEVITLSGYSAAQKNAIARRCVWPKLLRDYKLEPGDVALEDDAIDLLITDYDVSSGIRDIEKSLERLLQHVLLKRHTNENVPGITKELIISLLRKNAHRGEAFTCEVGSAPVLAVTGNLGVTLQVQVDLKPGNGEIRVTGLPSQSVKDSCMLALHLAQKAIHAAEPLDAFIHFSEGAVQKDGTSAGIMIYLAILSALTGKALKKGVCGTGEIDLHGHVYAVGGLAEKVNAAERAGFSEMLIPAENTDEAQRILASGTCMQLIPIHHMSQLADWLTSSPTSHFAADDESLVLNAS